MADSLEHTAAKGMPGDLSPLLYAPEILTPMIEAQLADAGIRCFVLGQCVSGLNFAAAVTPECGVHVRASEYESARRVIEEFMKSNAETLDVPEHCMVCGYSLDGLKEPKVCPECGEAASEFRTTQIRFAETPRESVIGTVRVGAMLGWVVLGFVALGAVVVVVRLMTKS